MKENKHYRKPAPSKRRYRVDYDFEINKARAIARRNIRTVPDASRRLEMELEVCYIVKEIQDRGHQFEPTFFISPLLRYLKEMARY